MHTRPRRAASGPRHRLPCRSPGPALSAGAWRLLGMTNGSLWVRLPACASTRRFSKFCSSRWLRPSSKPLGQCWMRCEVLRRAQAAAGGGSREAQGHGVRGTRWAAGRAAHQTTGRRPLAGATLRGCDKKADSLQRNLRQPLRVRDKVLLQQPLGRQPVSRGPTEKQCHHTACFLRDDVPPAVREVVLLR